MMVTVHDYEHQPGGFTHCVRIEHGDSSHIVFLHKDGWIQWMDKPTDEADDVIDAMDAKDALIEYKKGNDK